MAAKAKKKKEPLTLLNFIIEKKRRHCKVCALPLEIIEQVRSARSRAVRLPEVVEWLKAEHGITLTRADFEAHHSGRHEK